MLTADSFRPARLLQNGQIQTILASSPFRAWGRNPMLAAAQERIIETPPGVRLLGAFSPHESNRSKGLVILLHGWEGSAESTYIVCTGNTLYRAGYDVFRLNFRDHGDSHHLNRGIFYAVLLDEVFEAVHQISREAGVKPVFVVGFSLGGNFALRIARKLTDTPIDNLRHVVAISPVLDPEKSTARVDQNPLIRKYFLKKWRRSLDRKQNLFPDLYDFTAVSPLKTIRAVTDYLLSEYSDFASAGEYFRGYSLLNDAIGHLPVATTIITAGDDPIIPVDDFYRLRLDGRTNLVIHDFGGHNGFVDGLLLKSWYEEKLADFFDATIVSYPTGIRRPAPAETPEQ
jgi:predicted alpha/beta-fold hydrolase